MNNIIFNMMLLSVLLSTFISTKKNKSIYLVVISIIIIIKYFDIWNEKENK